METEIPDWVHIMYLVIIILLYQLHKWIENKSPGLWAFSGIAGVAAAATKFIWTTWSTPEQLLHPDRILVFAFVGIIALILYVVSGVTRLMQKPKD